MVRTASTMLALGTEAPDFELINIDGRPVKRDDFRGSKALLVMFICNHCPYVKHIAPELARLGSEYQQRGVAVVAISSNDASKYPDDSPERMIHEAEERGYTFPYLYDEEQAAAQAYRAACTPDLYLFDRSRTLVYRGRFDESRPRTNPPMPVTGRDIRAAVDAVLESRPVPPDQKGSVGCIIKWKRGNAPEYF